MEAMLRWVCPSNGTKRRERRESKSSAGEIKAQSMTLEALAKKIGISRNSMSAKLNGRTQFNADEIEKICMALGISDPERKVEIFLS